MLSKLMHMYRIVLARATISLCVMGARLSPPFLQPSSTFMAPLPATRVTAHQHPFVVIGVDFVRFFFKSTIFDANLIGTEFCLPSCAHRGCGIPGHEFFSHGILSTHKHQVAEYISVAALILFYFYYINSWLVKRSSATS